MSPSELGTDSLTNLGPRSSRVLTGQRTACTPLELRRPRRTDGVGVVVLVTIETGQEVRSELGAAIGGKGQRITQERVRIDRHRPEGYRHPGEIAVRHACDDTRPDAPELPPRPGRWGMH